MRISGWSSDVCSSDLAAGGGQRGAGRAGTDLQPGRLARLDRAAADERHRLHLRVPAVCRPARLFQALRAHAADRVDHRPADPPPYAGAPRPLPPAAAAPPLPPPPAPPPPHTPPPPPP